MRMKMEPERRSKPPRYGRSDTRSVARWFWEIDKVLVILVAVLIVIGLIAVAAASPAAGQRLSGEGSSVQPLYYFYRQLIWIALAIPVMVLVSMLPKARARRLCLLGAAVFTGLLFLVPVIGTEINGAQRWIGSGFARMQPSEFLKPLFIVSIAWLLSLKEKDRSLPVVPLTAILTGIIALLLMRQPNFGETIIFVSAWVLLLACRARRCGSSTYWPRARSGPCCSPISSIRSRPSGSTASCSRRATPIRSNWRCGP